MNIYEFVRNNPIQGVDPHGEWVWIPCIIIGGILVGCTDNSAPPPPTDDDGDCECICESVSVTFDPGGASFGGTRIIDSAAGRWGNDINVRFKVTGDPKKCSYRHIEAGTATYTIPGETGQLVGQDNDATTAAVRTWHDDGFEYTDGLGVSNFGPPLPSGLYLILFQNFTMEMTCTGTDGNTISSGVFDIDGSHSDLVPTP